MVKQTAPRSLEWRDLERALSEELKMRLRGLWVSSIQWHNYRTLVWQSVHSLQESHIFLD